MKTEVGKKSCGSYGRVSHSLLKNILIFITDYHNSKNYDNQVVNINIFFNKE
jgi:hypothetical protein